MIVLMMGLPGSGKGQISRRLENIGFSTIATGKLIREEIIRESDLGLKLKPLVDSASYVDDEIVIDLVKKHFDKQKDLVLEGFPRNQKQADGLEKILKNNGKKIDVVLHFDFTEDEMYKRLEGRQLCKLCQSVYHRENSPSKDGKHCDKCGGELIRRIDDQPEKLKRKLNQYRENIKPLINHYEGLGLVREIDAKQNALDMYYDVIESEKAFMMRLV